VNGSGPFDPKAKKKENHFKPAKHTAEHISSRNSPDPLIGKKGSFFPVQKLTPEQQRKK